jgi:type II secretion system protein G
MKNGSKKGFTLIELLIVIAIIGILAVALLPTILSAPQKGRDAARISALSSFVTAIEAANLDRSGYPTTSQTFTTSTNSWAPSIGGTTTTMENYFQGKQIPKDPGGKSYVYCPAISGVNGVNYFLIATMETPASANIATVPTVCTTLPTVTTQGGVPTCGTGGCGYVMIK